jgi:DNA-binding PadR family transcriptional regulator
VLEGAGLVEHRSVGTRNLYALAPEGFTALQQWLVNTWDRALGAFAERIAEMDREGERR